MSGLPWADLWRAPLNALAFGLRQAVRHSVGLPELKQEPKEGLYDYLEEGVRALAEARELELRSRYDLEPLRCRSTQLDYRDNVYLLDALETLWGEEVLRLPREGRLRVVDVGSQTFAYAFALERFLRWGGLGAQERGMGAASPREVELLGVELDGYVPYRDGHARCDWARAHAALCGTGRVRYQVADFGLLAPEAAEVLTFFYPFVSLPALLRWGLPWRTFGPERLFASAASRLDAAGGGWMVVFSQTQEERERLFALLDGMPEAERWECVRTLALPSSLVDYAEKVEDRQASLFRRRLSSPEPPEPSWQSPLASSVADR